MYISLLTPILCLARHYNHSVHDGVANLYAYKASGISSSLHNITFACEKDENSR